MARLMTYLELAQELRAWAGLRLSKRRLAAWRAQGLPAVVLGPKTLRYDVGAVQAWILAHTESLDVRAQASDKAFRQQQPREGR